MTSITRPARGLVLAFFLFAAAFALHIVGGATDQGWLFAIAVALIFVTAGSYPLTARILGRVSPGRERTLTTGAGVVIGILLMAAALWAANGRAMAWWVVPVAAAFVLLLELGGRRGLRER
jgi:hypothetical protein